MRAATAEAKIGADRRSARNPIGPASFSAPRGSICVNSYYCIINLPGVPVREIAALGASDDTAAERETARLADRWPGFETIALYDGERPVLVLANPHLGFAIDALMPDAKAA